MKNYNEYSEKPVIALNFGPSFSYRVNASSFNENVAHSEFQASIEGKLVDSTDLIEKSASEEEERHLLVHLSLITQNSERALYKAALNSFEPKSYSRFPPSVYKRSIAAMKIQRSWRRYSGRVMRQNLRIAQYNAASIIQQFARIKLKKIRMLKNVAAAIIQKNWRRKKFVWIALFRCIYQRPIPEVNMV